MCGQLCLFMFDFNSISIATMQYMLRFQCRTGHRLGTVTAADPIWPCYLVATGEVSRSVKNARHLSAGMDRAWAPNQMYVIAGAGGRARRLVNVPLSGPCVNGV